MRRKNRFTIERLRKVTQSLSKLLNITSVELNYNKISDELFGELLIFAEKSTYCESVKNNKLLFRNKPIGADTNHSSNHILIDKNSKTIPELIWNLYELLKNHEKYQTIVLIISESLCHRMKQSFQLMCLLYDLRLNLKLIPVSNVNSELEFDDYIKSLNEMLLQQNSDSLNQSSGII